MSQQNVRKKSINLIQASGLEMKSEIQISYTCIIAGRYRKFIWFLFYPSGSPVIEMICLWTERNPPG